MIVTRTFPQSEDYPAGDYRFSHFVVQPSPVINDDNRPWRVAYVRTTPDGKEICCSRKFEPVINWFERKPKGEELVTLVGQIVGSALNKHEAEQLLDGGYVIL